jgi:hypothetical protein
VAGAVNAQTSTLTFEGQANTIYNAPIVRSGYRLGNPAGQEQHFHEIDSTQFGLPSNGTGILLNDRDTQIYTILDAGGTFVLNSVDVAAALGNLPAVGMEIRGFLGGFPTGMIVVPSLGNGYTTVNGGALGTVDTLVFDGISGGGGFCLDNMKLTVPAPGAAGMLALAGLAAARRRR